MQCTAEQLDALRQLATAAEQLTMLYAKLQCLPEQRALDELQAALQKQREQRTRQQLAQQKQWRSVARLRQDIAKMRERRTAVKQALSATTDPNRRRDLRHDLDGTTRRIAEMEARLERMTRTQGLFSAEEPEPIDTQLAAATERRDSAVQGLRRRMAECQQQLEQARSVLPAEVLEEYDQQEQEHGVGATPLRGHTCGGCFMALDAATLRHFRSLPAGSVPRCPECQVLLLIEPTA